jgi:demethoxyubiquinone hydroxylase (CLK1/Coq7/Cat5 family)
MSQSITDNRVSRGQFLRNSAKGGIALVVGGGLLASVEGVAFAAGGVSDNSTLQAAYAAETLAVHVYEGVLANFAAFKHPKLMNIDYFQHALSNEKDHRAFLGAALGAKAPTSLTLKIPASALASGQAVLNFGVALETAFVETYLGAVDTLTSNDLKLVAAKVAANEATHFSFFDAAAGGHGVLPSLPSTVTVAQAATVLTPYIPNLTARLTAAGFPNA